MAARRGQAFSGGSIRSGRFSYDNTAGPEKKIVVIDSKANSVYRFFNTGTSSFKVKTKGSTGTGITVEPKSSIDVKVSAKIVIVVAAGETVEGIYDYAESHSGVRSGRFVGDLAPGKPKTMISGRTGSFYRIFNSGENTIALKNGASPLVEIEPRHSLDMVVNNSVLIGTKGTTTVKAEAIYDYLDSDKPVRSGRFKRTVALNPATLHEIIDFRSYVNPPMGQKVPYALYRIFNSGKKPFKIVVKDGGMQTTLRTLEVEQSMDIGFNADGFAGNKSVWVQSTATTDPIEGIYEFLGFDAD